MAHLTSLLAATQPLTWRELRDALPRCIELPATQGLNAHDEADEDDTLFKRIDRVSLNELESHLSVRTRALQHEMEALQSLSALHRLACSAGCESDADAPILAMIASGEVGQ